MINNLFDKVMVYNYNFATDDFYYVQPLCILFQYVTRHQNLKPLGRGSVREFELQNFRGATVNGHHDSLHKLTMTRMNEGDASLVISHQDAEFPDKSFSIEGRVSGVGIIINSVQ